MIAVRHQLVAAFRPMHMTLIVSAAIVRRRATRRIRWSTLDNVIVDMAAMHVVHMSIMQVVGVPIVLNCSVAAIRAVLVAMALVFRTIFSHAHTIRSAEVREKDLTVTINPGARSTMDLHEWL